MSATCKGRNSASWTFRSPTRTSLNWYRYKSLLLEMRGKTWYPFARLVLSDCALDVWSMGRLARALRTSILTHLHLDYNRIGDTGALALVQGLAGNAQMLSLSLCYCGLGPPSGAPLASLVTSTAIVEVYLDGNDLRCEGATELVRPLVEHAERVAATRPRLDVGDGEDLAKQLLDAPDKSGVRSAVSLLDEGEQPAQVPVDPSGSSIAKRKKSRRGARRKKKGPEKAEVGPWLRKLHLSDNGIDGLGAGRQTAPLDFSMLLARLIRLSDALQELDLDDNDVGELGGRQILEALKQRKEAKRLPIKMRVTARMSPDTFSAILKYSGKVKKARRGKKKKKK
ncbi:ribonuclease inhibitor-like isoform X2 [Petromyzon marinus]|uniref:ribonuclease inhibitor-like isoform X2 n=1 Tax=Petromyzon marinus TaxID=7757 RepID=UPI003F72047D